MSFGLDDTGPSVPSGRCPSHPAGRPTAPRVGRRPRSPCATAIPPWFVDRLDFLTPCRVAFWRSHQPDAIIADEHYRDSQLPQHWHRTLDQTNMDRADSDSVVVG